MQKTLTELSNDKSSDYSLRKATKRLRNPINQIPPLMDINNKWAKSNLAKAEVFAKHLTNTFSPNDNNIIPYSNSAKYLGMTLDAKLRWKEHVMKKKEHWILTYQKCIGLLVDIQLYQYIINC